MQGLSQRHYDNMMTFKEERDTLEKNVKYLRDENERLKREKSIKRTMRMPSVPRPRRARRVLQRGVHRVGGGTGRVYLPCPSSPRQ